MEKTKCNDSQKLQQRLAFLASASLNSTNREKGDLEFYLNFLLANGFDVNQNHEVVTKAIQSLDENAAMVLLDKFTQLPSSFLIDAIDSQNWGVVRKLIDNGVSTREDDDEAFCLACLKDAPIDIIAKLYELGANINAQKGKPLCNSIRCNNTEIFDFLVEKHADISIQKNLPVRLAAKSGNLYMVNELDSRGADITACNNEALFNAAIIGSAEIFEKLLTSGADGSARHKALLECTSTYEDTSCLEVLLANCEFTAMDYSQTLIARIERFNNVSAIVALSEQMLYKSYVRRAIKEIKEKRKNDRAYGVVMKKLKSALKNAIDD